MLWLNIGRYMIGRDYIKNKTDYELIGKIGFGETVSIDTDKKVKVLVTGAGSYIGDSFKSYAEEKYSNNFCIDCLDMLNIRWKNNDFSKYDVVYHVAGIAHADIGKVNDKTKEKYYKVNTDLAIEVAEKSKKDGVKCFIFMSSMIVYGDSAQYGKEKVITKDTIPNPSNFYGDSKLQADVKVRTLANDSFKVIVLRPPMIYGRGSKGNYKLLSKIAKKSILFPKVNNCRSMLYIGNFCEFLCQIMLIKVITSNEVVLIPQNKEWVNTSDMVLKIANTNGNNIRLLGGVLKIIVKITSKIPGKIGELVNKAFGNNCYDHSMSIYPGFNYQNIDFSKSIIETEAKN